MEIFDSRHVPTFRTNPIDRVRDALSNGISYVILARIFRPKHHENLLKQRFQPVFYFPIRTPTCATNRTHPNQLLLKSSIE